MREYELIWALMKAAEAMKGIFKAVPVYMCEGRKSELSQSR